MDSQEQLRKRLNRDLLRNAPLHMMRLHWPAERLAAERQHRLRRLVAFAKQRSPWFARRLASIDPDRVTEASLRDIAPMTKQDVVTHFDDVVTDRRITKERAAYHVEHRPPGELLFGQYRVITSGGSTGQNAMWIYGHEAWQLARLGHLRMSMRAQLMSPRDWFRKTRIAVVAADAPSHMSSALARSYQFPFIENNELSIADPLSKIVADLNAVQPTVVATYGSMFAELVKEAASGNLRIKPRRVLSTSDRLMPETRQAIAREWGAAISDVWATSECGATAVGCFQGDGMHLSDDLIIYEFVDLHGNPVRPGERCAKVYLTNLTNPTIPLIRYELTDSVDLLEEPCPCGSTHRRIGSIHGRVEEAFHYGDVRLPPYPFRLVLEHEPHLVQYQVHQTQNGARLALEATGPIDCDRMARHLEGELARHGITNPKVEVHMVERIERGPSGKVRHFIPLDTNAATGTQSQPQPQPHHPGVRELLENLAGVPHRGA